MKRLLTTTTFALLLVASTAGAVQITGPMPRDPVQRQSWFARNPNYTAPDNETINFAGTARLKSLAILEAAQDDLADELADAQREHLAGDLSEKGMRKAQKKYARESRAIREMERALTSQDAYGPNHIGCAGFNGDC
jgi:hypothetical protein